MKSAVCILPSFYTVQDRGIFSGTIVYILKIEIDSINLWTSQQKNHIHENFPMCEVGKNEYQVITVHKGKFI